MASTALSFGDELTGLVFAFVVFPGPLVLAAVVAMFFEDVNNTRASDASSRRRVDEADVKWRKTALREWIEKQREKEGNHG
jgi:hypothetical protein